MRVLGIESSCDECSLAVVDDGVHCVGMHTYSQIAEHERYHGVVPELASRLHVKHILTLYKTLFADCGIAPSSIDGIAVTNRPGLSGSLMVGLSFAKALSLSLHVPFTVVDHIHAHFYSARVQLNAGMSDASPGTSETHCIADEDVYPYVGCVASGGHTIFARVENYDDIQIMGTTIDDACGEVFDKVARELGLGYPGGAALDKLSQMGDDVAYDFPVYSAKLNGYNVSYSGLKTAVVKYRDKYRAGIQKSHAQENIADIAASFSRAAIHMITDRVNMACRESGIRTVCFGGGVACNSRLRAACSNNEQLRAVFPPPALCADNGAMIAGLGCRYLARGAYSALDEGVSARTAEYRRDNK